MNKIQAFFNKTDRKFLVGLCLLAAGILFFFVSEAAVSVLIRIGGVILIVTAAVRLSLLMKAYERGAYFAMTLLNVALLFLLGALMLITPDGARDLIYASIGGYLVFNAVSRAVRITKAQKAPDSSAWWVSIILTAAVFLLGLWLLISPAEGSRITGIIAGASLAVKGCEMLFSAFGKDRDGKHGSEDIEADFIDKSDK